SGRVPSRPSGLPPRPPFRAEPILRPSGPDPRAPPGLMHVPASLLASAAAPVVDIDGTFFIQAGIFLLLMAILYPLLFKPWLATQQRREQAIAGTTAAASDLRARAEEEARNYDTRLAEVRARASGI